ncbi:Co-chaperone Hsc20 [Piromyces finnis]|uniref:Co-chaperone Hsc20 n=1 Tax=Piromyces finnis TaxID=1754191 RepID=A0A1Y1V363_9FUNG|nr:Co-chaperone Hsc20 [Piromyces finnis]|eukprot:ORX45591.1 Co-chaperone Hsc20 [Piromyces finnis]
MSLIQQQQQSLKSIKNVLPALTSGHHCGIARNFSLKNNYHSLSTQSGVKLNTSLNNYFSQCKEALAFSNTCFKSQQQRFYSTPTNKKCWKCDADNKIEAIFCEKCKTVQNLSRGVDYFSIFGIQRSFDIDLKSLKAKFLKLQQAVHPDNYSTKSDKEKEYSEQQSSYLNKAYHCLVEPLDRATYLLTLLGHPTEESETLNNNVEFLMEIMTINEFIDNAECIEDIEDIFSENEARIDLAIRNLSIFFQAEVWEAAQNETIKLRYWKNIERSLKDWQPKNKGKK